MPASLCPENICVNQREVSFKRNGEERQASVFSDPVSHVVVDAQNAVHGWKEELKVSGATQGIDERLIVNPYHGCGNACFYCYAHNQDGFYGLFRKRGIIAVFKDCDRVVGRELDGLLVASCGYICTLTDPFQEINYKYRLSEKIIFEFVKRNIPVAFATKSVIPKQAIDVMKTQPDSYAHVSIPTLDEPLRRLMMAEGATVEGLLTNLRRLKEAGVPVVVQISPILPYLSDDPRQLKRLIEAMADLDIKHIMGSCVGIPNKMKQSFYAELENMDRALCPVYQELFTEKIHHRHCAKIDYRVKLFTFMKETCQRVGITFALAGEYGLGKKQNNGRYHIESLNKFFMTSKTTEGVDVPLYVRVGEKFMPVNGSHANVLPGISSRESLTLEDFKRLSKEAAKPKPRRAAVGSLKPV